ncbi:MAG: hypothetical protein JO126_06200 [Alphaproteobacteria bacterium]|nr:hypothetical protein [Alphaproteobacteria bacterium]MBV8549029.1 hypothetical protein [Alphaproteobacteria bacterium]
MTLGILTGLETEAALARKIPNSIVTCSGARPARARVLAREMIAKGATCLMSFGIAGGLSSEAPVGSTVIATHIVSHDNAWNCDPAWITRLADLMPHALLGGVWGSETLVPTAEEKLALYNQSRCLSVDMESQCAAEIAAQSGVPMIVVRTVCDAAHMNVPPLVMNAIKEDGSTDVGRAVVSLLRYPRQIKSLIDVQKGVTIALQRLEACATLLAAARP